MNDATSVSDVIVVFLAAHSGNLKFGNRILSVTCIMFCVCCEGGEAQTPQSSLSHFGRVNLNVLVWVFLFVVLGFLVVFFYVVCFFVWFFRFCFFFLIQAINATG